MNTELLKHLEKLTKEKEPCTGCLVVMKCKIPCDRLQRFIYSISLEKIGDFEEEYRRFVMNYFENQGEM